MESVKFAGPIQRYKKMRHWQKKEAGNPAVNRELWASNGLTVYGKPAQSNVHMIELF